MKRISAVIVYLAMTLCLLATSGCLVQESSKYGPIEPLDTAKMVDNHVDLALRYISRGNREMARSHLARALELDASSSGAYTAYALLYDQEGEDALAEESFQQAIRSNSADTRAKFYYGVFLSDQQRFEEARKLYRKVVADVEYPNRTLALISLGQTELKLGESDTAQASFEHALRLNPKAAPAYLEIANLHYLAERYSEAKLYLQRFNRLSRPTARSLWLGVRLENRFNDKDAEASYGLALKNLFPNSKENLAYQEWLEHAQQK